MVDNSTGTGEHIGMQQELGGSHNEGIKGISTYIANTGDGLHTGITTSVQNGIGNQIGNQATLRGSTGTNSVFTGTIFNSGSGSSAIQTGLSLTVEQPTSQISYGILNYVTAPGTTATGTKFGLYNLIDGGTTGNHYGVYNDVRGTGSNTKYGTYNLFGIGSTNTGGVLYGNYNSFGTSITSTSNKYGNYTIIPSTLGGTHYGTYNDVQNTSGYAGYFIGRVSLGNTTTNRYTMPAADGAAGEVLTAAGDGTTSWTTPSGTTTSIMRAELSSSQIVTSATHTKILFDTPQFDTNGDFDATNNRFVVPRDGYYRVNSAIAAFSASAGSLFVEIYKNGALYHRENFGTGAISQYKTNDGIVNLDANEYIEIFVYCSPDYNVSLNYSFFEVQEIK